MVGKQRPNEVWYAWKLFVKHLEVFCYICYAQIPKVKRNKVHETSEKSIVLGVIQI